MLKNKRVQNTKSKVQSSISHTPEGTDTKRICLIVAERGTIIKVYAATVMSIESCTTPVASGGVTR